MLKCSVELRGTVEVGDHFLLCVTKQFFTLLVVIGSIQYYKILITADLIKSDKITIKKYSVTSKSPAFKIYLSKSTSVLLAQGKLGFLAKNHFKKFHFKLNHTHKKSKKRLAQTLLFFS